MTGRMMVTGVSGALPSRPWATAPMPPAKMRRPTGAAAVRSRCLRVVIAESLSYPKIAVLFHEAGPKLGHCALESFLRRHVAVGNLHVDDPARGVTEFLALLRGDYQYALMLGLREPPGEEERARHVKRVVEQFMLLYGR